MEPEIHYHYIGTNGFGIYLDWDEFVDFTMSYARQHDIPVGNIDKDDFEDAELYRVLSMCTQMWKNDKAIENYDILDDHFDGSDVYYLDYYTREGDGFVYGFILYSYRQGRIFDHPEEESPDLQTYKDIHEMAHEFRKRIGQYLPKDFDYEDHLATFSGAQKVGMAYWQRL